MYSFLELAEKFEERFIADLRFPVTPITLYEPCSYLLRSGGKRIRPVLCLMGNELFTEINEAAWQAAMGIELFHNFTLIHDDIMDKAPLRRGNPTIHSKYGLTAGILCGDVLNIYSYTHFASITRSLQEILHVFNKTAIEVCEGQQLDMDYEERNDVTIAEYLHMITLKTSVLLACSLKIGAIAGGALGDSADNLYEFGKNMGIAFQLQDDYLDAFGDSEKLGKQNGGDILCNKKTYLLIKAMENANEEQLNEIETLMIGDNTNKVASMLKLYSATGADIQCMEAAGNYATKAFQYLDDLAVPAKRKQPLRELANYLLTRDK